MGLSENFGTGDGYGFMSIGIHDGHGLYEMVNPLQGLL